LKRVSAPSRSKRAALASDDAAYVTGSTYYVDGGMVRMAKSL